MAVSAANPSTHELDEYDELSDEEDCKKKKVSHH